jgi:hypothetical protein
MLPMLEVEAIPEPVFEDTEQTVGIKLWAWCPQCECCHDVGEHEEVSDG